MCHMKRRIHVSYDGTPMQTPVCTPHMEYPPPHMTHTDLIIVLIRTVPKG